MTSRTGIAAGMLAVATILTGSVGGQPRVDKPVLVTADNFIRAESDFYFGNIVKDGGFGKFHHIRELTPIDQQLVVRSNRDTLYSAGVFDLDAGVVTVFLPDAGDRFLSLQVITEDHYSPDVVYEPGRYSFSREKYVTRYLALVMRILVNPFEPGELEKAHSLQDALQFEQFEAGRFEVPNWDQPSQKKVRDALKVLGSTIPDSKGMFGRKEDVSAVRHLIGTATAWGGNPDSEATYLTVTPAQNDGKTVYRLTVQEVPADGFWSISVYNAEGYFQPNKENAYTLNNHTVKRNAGGSVSIQFGGDPSQTANWLPITPGWNYVVRLYRPRKEILDGTWKFPEAQPVR